MDTKQKIIELLQANTENYAALQQAEQYANQTRERLVRIDSQLALLKEMIGDDEFANICTEFNTQGKVIDAKEKIQSKQKRT